MKGLVVATRNRGKFLEIRNFLENLPISLCSLEDFPNLPDVEEDGDTFEENAIKKASTMAELTGLPAIADDSGLVVDALGGRPGVHSARYAGMGATDEMNNAKLLEELRGVPTDGRGAAFRCVIALCRPHGPCVTFEGTLRGRILETPQGTGGFGYDPLFLVESEGKTLAELSLERKNQLSHRGNALNSLKKYLLQIGSL